MDTLLFIITEEVLIFNHLQQKTKPGITFKMASHLGNTNLPHGRRKVNFIRPVYLLHETLVPFLLLPLFMSNNSPFS